MKSRFRRLLVIALSSMACANDTCAQDVHFSQFFTSPLAINPAQTGNFNGSYRVGFNAKMQWPALIDARTYTYHTESPYVDFSFGERKIKTGWMGIGFNFLNDEAGDGRLTYQRFGLNYAYHQAFDKENRYVLSAGVGVHYIIRSVDFSKFYFNNQWLEDEGFDLSQANFEPVERQRFGMVDISAGINFRAQINDQVRLQLGFSMLHLNRPKHSFLGMQERLGFRYQASAGGQYQINERMSLNVDGYYSYQKKASEIQLSALFGYGFLTNRISIPNHVVYAGLAYRIKDALSPVVGYQFKTTRVLLSYDITLSKLSGANRVNGGPEIYIAHTGKWYREFSGNKVFCPRF